MSGEEMQLSLALENIHSIIRIAFCRSERGMLHAYVVRIQELL